MGKIVYDLLPNQKTRKHNLKVQIDYYPYATELCEELDKIGIMHRIKEIPQLGVIRVKKRLSKTRYDYMMLQLYLHQLIKNNLQGDLRLTYNNYINANEFRDDYKYIDKINKPSIGDILQLLTIVYNIGHFYNTFTSSRAVVILASEDKKFFNMIINASESERFKNAAKKILNDKNYQRLHLLNSILILEKCDQTKSSISLALEILYSYLGEELLPDESKLKYAFSIFRSVRTVSYAAYDLQISETPITIDLCNEKAMVLLLKELLSEYNNTQPSKNMIKSITKLLDDTVYNENSNAICYYKISRKMVSLINKDSDCYTKKYIDYILDKDSILNRTYPQKRDYVQSNILKITFTKDEKSLSERLLLELEKTNNTRVGYYDRNSGDRTILVSIKNSCDSSQKRYASFKTMQYTISILRHIEHISVTDTRFLLCVKFFLFYLFDENPVVIKPTIDKEKCVICTRGKNARVNEVKLLLNNSIGNQDQNHEVEFLLSQIINDIKNDTTVTIPASILVYQKNAVGRKLCEFDGMIIHPMRKSNQVVFLEAKNKSRHPSTGKNCLKEKFDNFTFEYLDKDIEIIDCDACWKYTL